MAILKMLSKSIWRLGWKWRAGRVAALDIGALFPDFSLNDLQGRAHRLSVPSEAEHTVLWLTNLCEDCRSKVPLLEELRLAAGRKVRILAVSILGDDRTLPQAASADCGFPFLLDPNDIVAREFGLSHPPQTCPLNNLFILDKDGRIIFRHHLSALKPEAFRSLWKEWNL